MGGEVFLRAKSIMPGETYFRIVFDVNETNY